MVDKVMGELAKINPPLREVIPKYKTNTPANLKNLRLNVSPKIVVKNPKPKNKGNVNSQGEREKPQPQIRELWLF